jgi:excisionase family DNA binding protein
MFALILSPRSKAATEIEPKRDYNHDKDSAQIYTMIAYYFKVMYIILNSAYFILIIKETSMERLMTTEEVAELLRIDPVTVRRLVTRGELIGYRIAGEYRFTPAGVENFVENQRVVVSMEPGPNHPLAKFTERARKVLSLANEEASRYNHDGVGTEHMLLAIMSVWEGVGARVLNQLQVQPDEVRAKIETLHPAGKQPLGDSQIGVTQQGKGSLELAVQEAQYLGHHYIGTEHMLLGLLREEEGLASKVLLESGVTLEKARELVKQLLAAKQTTSAPKSEEHSES